MVSIYLIIYSANVPLCLCIILSGWTLSLSLSQLEVLLYKTDWIRMSVYVVCMMCVVGASGQQKGENKHCPYSTVFPYCQVNTN